MPDKLISITPIEIWNYNLIGDSKIQTMILSLFKRLQKVEIEKKEKKN